MSRACKVVLLALLVVSMGAAWGAAEQTIYIRNHPYKGKSLVQANVVWLPINAYATAMGLIIHSNGAAYCITDDHHSDTNCPIKSHTDAVLFVNGNDMTASLTQTKGENWINAKTVTQALGGGYVPNKDMGILDITLQRMPTAAEIKTIKTETVASQLVMVHYYADW